MQIIIKYLKTFIVPQRNMIIIKIQKEDKRKLEWKMRRSLKNHTKQRNIKKSTNKMNAKIVQNITT